MSSKQRSYCYVLRKHKARRLFIRFLDFVKIMVILSLIIITLIAKEEVKNERSYWCKVANISR